MDSLEIIVSNLYSLFFFVVVVFFFNVFVLYELTVSLILVAKLVWSLPGPVPTQSKLFQGIKLSSVQELLKSLSNYLEYSKRSV